MENKLQFRSAGFGGFNRQDVLDYIEQTAKETAQQLDELQAKCDAGLEREAALTQQANDLTNQLNTLQEQLDALSSERDGAVNRLKKLEPLQLQVPLLQSQVDRLTPAAEAYSGLKNQISDIELESRRRAGEIVNQAQKEAAKITAAAQSKAQDQIAAAQSKAQEQIAAAKQATDKLLSAANKDATTRITSAKKQAEETVSNATRQASAITKQAQQQIAAEQARAKNMRTQLQNSYDAARADIQETVTRSLGDLDHMHSALLSLQTIFKDAKKLLTDPAAQEKGSE